MRGVVFLFLFYTAADITYPQICGEEFGGAATATKRAGADNEVNASSQSRLTALDESQPDQPQNQEPRDEDCFCCCAHVIAGVVFVPPGMPQTKLGPLQNEQLAIPQNHFENPNPPPRLV